MTAERQEELIHLAWEMDNVLEEEWEDDSMDYQYGECWYSTGGPYCTRTYGGCIDISGMSYSEVGLIITTLKENYEGHDGFNIELIGKKLFVEWRKS